MSEFKQVVSGSLWQWAGKFIGLIFGFFATVFLIRYLGDTEYGYYTTVMAYLHFAVVLIDLGLYFVLVKQLADKNSGAAINNIFTLRLVSGTLALLIFCGLVWLIPGYNDVIKIGVVICAANFLLMLLTQILTAIFQQHLKMTWVAIAEATAKIFLLLSTLAVIYYFKSGIYSVFILVTVTTALNFLILYWAASKYHHFRLAWDWSIWKQSLALSWPMGLAIALGLIYFKGDSLILSFYRPASEVGIYGAVYKVLEVLVTIPVIFVGLVLPVLSASYLNKQQAKLQLTLQRSFDLISLIALPLVGGTLVVAPALMQAIAGTRFTENPLVLGQLLRILIFAVGLIFYNTLFTYLMVSLNRQKTMLWAYLFTAITSIGLYLIMIPKYSYFGAASVTVYSEFCTLIASAYLVLKTTGCKLKFNLFWKILVAAVIMSLVLYALNFIAVIPLVLLGEIIYCLVLYVLKVDLHRYAQKMD